MKLPSLKMEGRSGCSLVVEQQQRHTIIRKFSSSVSYNTRLIKQAKKQKHFFDLTGEDSQFTTANVFDIYNGDENLAWFTMPYLFAEKYSDYLDRLNYRDLKKLLKSLLQYFRDSIYASKVDYLDESILTEKIKTIKENLLKNNIQDTSYFFDVLVFLENNMPTPPVPLGTCHGDFTFSNILFGDSQIYLLDFLDSFIESPLIDIVKLRQDTCFKWSIMIEHDMPRYKSNKLIQVFNFLDKEIENFIDHELGMNEWYQYLQVFNLIRIVPYLSKEHEVTFIQNALKQLLK